MRSGIAAAVLAGLALVTASGAAHGLPWPATSERFDDIRIGGSQLYVPDAAREPSETVAVMQILMDRTGISPGVIDGLDTPRFRAALDHWRIKHDGMPMPDDRQALDAQLEETGGPAFARYTITPDDLAGPFRPELPVLYVHQASLPDLGFATVREMLAERFHVDEAYLAALNPGEDFSRAGAIINVPGVGRDLQVRVARIEADKAARVVRAYDAQERLIAAYPASIGSAATPSPTGTHTVRNKAQDPVYTYDPNGSAQPGMSAGLVRLPPGPNSPVGNAWIGLSKKSYGIHGTPEPSQIGIAESVGCVRLTNWDALELARLVRRGVEVAFID